MSYKDYLQKAKLAKISKNHTVYDICHSDTALAKGIDNTPSVQVIQNGTILTKNILDPIESYYNLIATISCMFRCLLLNKLLGGASTSQHMCSKAVDFIIHGIECKKIFNDIISGRIMLGKIPLKDIIDQCIFEQKGTSTFWIHISFDSKVRRKQFMTSLNSKYTIVTKEIL